MSENKKVTSKDFTPDSIHDIMQLYGSNLLHIETLKYKLQESVNFESAMQLQSAIQNLYSNHFKLIILAADDGELADFEKALELVKEDANCFYDFMRSTLKKRLAWEQENGKESCMHCADEALDEKDHTTCH